MIGEACYPVSGCMQVHAATRPTASLRATAKTHDCATCPGMTDFQIQPSTVIYPGDSRQPKGAASQATSAYPFDLVTNRPPEITIGNYVPFAPTENYRQN
jgi:hypothetical protein